MLTYCGGYFGAGTGQYITGQWHTVQFFREIGWVNFHYFIALIRNHLFLAAFNRWIVIGVRSFGYGINIGRRVWIVCYITNNIRFDVFLVGRTACSWSWTTVRCAWRWVVLQFSINATLAIAARRVSRVGSSGFRDMANWFTVIYILEMGNFLKCIGNRRSGAIFIDRITLTVIRSQCQHWSNFFL